MTIDEAIEHEKRISKDNKVHNFENIVNYHEQLVEWLEELKVLRTTFCGYSKEDIELNRNAIYKKGIDDFVKFANTMPTVEEEDGTIRPMWPEEIAKQLKESDVK